MAAPSTDTIGKQLRDEAYHLRVLAREHRNRSTTLARAFDDSLARIDALIAHLESSADDHTPEEAQVHDDHARHARSIAAGRPGPARVAATV